MVDVQNAGNVLKWVISVEGSADGMTQPWEQFKCKSSNCKSGRCTKWGRFFGYVEV